MADTIRIRVYQGLPGPPGTGAEGTFTGFTFWPREVTEQVVIPDGHTMPVRDVTISGEGEIVVGAGSELLVL